MEKALFSIRDGCVLGKAAESVSGLPQELENLLVRNGYTDLALQLGIPEHTVDLPEGVAASQSDVWALISTAVGVLSLSVEAKVQEPFGDDVLDSWLTAGGSARSFKNRTERWQYLRTHLPASESFGRNRLSDGY